MADIKFSCPNCTQHIACDPQWRGLKLQCPSCQNEILVPAGPKAVAVPVKKPDTTPKPPEQTAKPRTVLANPPPAPPPPINPPVPADLRTLSAKSGQSKRTLVAYGAAAAVLLAVGGALVFFQGSSGSDSEAASAVKAQTAAPEVKSDRTDEVIAPEATEHEAEKTSHWTLNVDEAEVPDAKAAGTIGGVEVEIKSPGLDVSGQMHILCLRGGTNVFSDPDVSILFWLKAGETLGGQKLRIGSDTRQGIPQVTKHWKEPGKSAMQTKTFSSGYVLKLELESVSGTTIPGKIYVALPDTDQTCVAGKFKANIRTITPRQVGVPVQRPVQPMQNSLVQRQSPAATMTPTRASATAVTSPRSAYQQQTAGGMGGGMRRGTNSVTRSVVPMRLPNTGYGR